MQTGIRFLLTNNCNYNCKICHHEGMADTLPHSRWLSPEDYVFIYRAYARVEPTCDVTFSGGEPLLYQEFDQLTEALYQAGARITVCTNGSLLAEHFDALEHVRQLNVSLHTLEPEIYAALTGRRLMPQYILDQLNFVHSCYPGVDIRLNIVPSAELDWSVHRLAEYIEVAIPLQATLKLLELFPRTSPSYVPAKTVKAQLRELSYREEDAPYYTRQRRYHRFPGIPSYPEIYYQAVVCSLACDSEDAHEFCRHVHDVYVTPDGQLSLCRLGPERIDIYDDVKRRDLEAVQLKLQVARLRAPRYLCLSRLRQVEAD